MKAIIGMVMAAALISPTWAGPGSIAPVVPGTGHSLAEQVRDGCGPGFFRNDFGRCRPERFEREGWREGERRFLECPRGFHLGPEGRRCWPN